MSIADNAGLVPTAAAPARRRKKRPSLSVLALGVYTIVMMAFLLAPIIAVVAVSFSASSFVMFPIEKWSLAWYRQMLAYQPFMSSLWVSIEVAAGSAVAAMVLGIPAALVLARSNHPAAQASTNLLVAPLAIPAIMLGFSLLYFLSMLSFGISMVALLIAHTVVSIPYLMRTVLAVYRSISPDLEQASAALGASRWQTLYMTTLPLIRPGIFAGALFSFLISLDNLPVSFFFGTAQTNTLPVVMLSYMQNSFDPSIAAMSTVQMLIAVLMLVAIEKTYGIRQLTVS